MTAGGAVDGLAVVDKEPGWTSHDVVAKCRGIFGQRRVGHAGTLDPDATGVLLVGLGRVTRLLRYLTALPKTYTAEIVLGVATTTLDGSGAVTGRWEMGSVTLAEARTAAAGLTGDILQIPPMVSALKHEGRRLHDLARQGVDVERPARPVQVERFALEWAPEPGVLSAEVTCSSGTYVRSLADDLGRALGGGAHLRRLRRTAVGSFTAGAGVAIAALGPEHVLPPAAALRDYATVEADAALAGRVAHGAVLRPPELAASGEGPWAVCHDGQLLAVYERAGDGYKPAVVIAAG